VAVGRVRGPRGVRGELNVDSLTDFEERFVPGATLWASGTAYTVRRSRAAGNTLLLELAGIDSREAAEVLRNQLLEIPEESLTHLPEGQYYRFQIVGLAVFDRAGHPLGHVEQIIETGANDVYIVRDQTGELLLPAIDAVVLKIDLEARRMTVNLIEGLERRPLRARPQSDSQGTTTL
jgi:16S rRNA processing protein RimM